jgi:TRAP-type C4-dicarboxylate transport system permease small subunit
MDYLGKKSKVRIIYDRVVSALSFTGAVWIVLLMLLIVSDVLGRNIFNQAITGTPEIVRNSIVGITFLQIAHVLRERRHIRSTVVLDRISSKWRLFLNIFAYLCGFLLFVILLYSGWEATWEALRTGEYEGEGSLHVPTFPARFLILLGSFFMALQFLVSIYDSIRHHKNNNIEDANTNDAGI